MDGQCEFGGSLLLAMRAEIAQTRLVSSTAMADDQSKIPTTPLITPEADDSPPPLSNTLLGAMLGAGRDQPREKWEPPTPEELQSDFPQHEIRGILGRGGMGAVYKGWHKNLERMVAIKILPPSLDDGASDFSERFKREARAMAQLNHPGIVSVYDAGQTHAGLLYFIMECVEGTDLQQLITKRGRLEPCEALRITAAVCDALSYAHRHGIIHRDIKPSNIMLDPNGTVKVADFGLAKSTAPGTTALTMSNVAMGTLDYIAPEVVHGAANADLRADLYAVGVMLYQMLTGKIPRGRFEPPSRVVLGLDRRLDRVVDRALQSDPANRYTCAAEFSAAIDPVTRSIARRAPVVTVSAASRKKAPLVALAAVGGVAVIAALVYFAPWKKNGGGGGKRSAASHASSVEVGKKTGGEGASPVAATKEKPFVNTLGMQFVPVPGTRVLFSIWETRVKDYAAFAAAKTVNGLWMLQDKEGVAVSREPDQPVCGVNWDDAKAFCEWLTQKEIAENKLPAGMKYRLPTDEEWSRAVGLEKENGATPKDRSGKDDVSFPWGTDFPPKTIVGNYADAAFHEQFPREQDKWIEGYADGFATTAPVGSFAPNAHGIFDLGGNVWEWCEDLFEAGSAERVVRGGSWAHYVPSGLLSSYRRAMAPGNRLSNYGFRCVLDSAR
jgi:formylglycine-generating enzyme required for sulfatase activity